MSATSAPRSWLARLGWFAALWLGGVVSVGAVAMLLRAWLKA